MTSPIPAAALDEALSIIGTTGAGKTYVAKGIVEQLLWQDHRICIIDPLDVWYGLRTTSGGDQPAFPVVVFGGEHADIPIEGVDGGDLGRLIAGGSVRASIICTAEMTGGETAKFMTPFFEALYSRNRIALHLVVDEADAFAPQNPMPEQARMKGAMDKIARRGRVRGFRLLTITQRPAVLDKSVMSMNKSLVAMQLTSPQDRKALQDWVKGNADEDAARDVLRSLPKLARGEGWIWSPQLDVLDRVTFPSITTLDTSRTPEHGEAVVEARAAAAVDIEAIRRAMLRFSTIPDGEKTSHGARDALKAVGETAAGMAQQVKDAEERGYQRGLAEGEALGYRRGQALQLTRMRSALDALRIDEIPAGSPVPDAGLSDQVAVTAAALTRHRKDAGPAGNDRQQPDRRPHPSAEASAEGTLNSAARKMLAVLDTSPPVRRTWTQVATLAGLKARGGHYNAGRKALIDGGMIRDVGGLIEHAAPTPGARPPATAAEVVDIWAGVLSGAAPKILRFLFGETSDGLGTRQGSREWIAEQLGMQPRGGHWNAAWKELRDNGLVEINGTTVRLHPAIFGGRS
ncbi:hypothetical protein OSH11_11945 [Kaistia dalseonensis]|uniref:Helicase HerA central domain-containing protein n=1 Tax=Kaistia dalseonensis TaxID=410840 RepID=A0ABU0H970_9HYPH|nr:hypothetical protein [Kaistia dalseonensis]MCX5495421.1 hypothetical protein [Kaistia dalseonensis]MDQ0438011.1 hypothetical protein [Kaistia dalseonensis]